MAFGDHVGPVLLAAWLGPALVIGAWPMWHGNPEVLAAGLTVAAPALTPTAFAVLYSALWILGRETGWPYRPTARVAGASRGRSDHRSRQANRFLPDHRFLPDLAFWLLVVGLPGLLSLPVALSAVAKAPPPYPAGLEGGDLWTLLRRGVTGTFPLVMLPWSCACATAVGLWLCAKRLSDRRRGATPDLPLAADLGVVAPTLAIGFLLAATLAVPAGRLAAGTSDGVAAAVVLAGMLALSLAAAPFLSPVALPALLLLYRWRRGRTGPGNRRHPPTAPAGSQRRGPAGNHPLAV
ncbi:hypothetical protein ACFOGJ_07160 [Marinibaculum pumilum]|uniref:Uncharacterized protein n=1 Tax=Marinibaculum pumilum TaxID=1766165 RepID=A0ABV7KXG4_9PROT